MINFKEILFQWSWTTWNSVLVRCYWVYGTVAMTMNNLSWSVLLEWSWTDWNCYNVPMVLEWTSFDDCMYLTGIWVCGVGENDCADWEGLSCLWLPLMTMEVGITWIYLAVMGSASPILLHDHEMLSGFPVALLLHWPLNCTDGKVGAQAGHEHD